ncbi:MAG: hypothetical protein ACRCSK_02820 [Fusobacteriaceae bacterium]
MKKVLLGLVALSAVATAAGNNVYLKGGVNFLGSYGYERTYDSSRSSETSSSKNNSASDNNKFDGAAAGIGFSADLIYTKSMSDNWEVGAGFAYQMNPKQTVQKTDSSSSYSSSYSNSSSSVATSFVMPSYTSMPLYLTAKYNFILDGSIKPFVQVSLGYSINSLGDKYAPEQGWAKFEENYNEGDSVPNQPGYKYTATETTTVEDKLSNGLYYSLGAGIEWNNFIVDLSYSLTQATYEHTRTTVTSSVQTPSTKGNNVSNETFNQNFGRITLGLGYKFAF